MKKEYQIKKIFVIILALACVSAVLWLAGSILSAKGILLPKWVKWESGTYYAGPVSCQIELAHKSVSILQDGDVIWTSPA